MGWKKRIAWQLPSLLMAVVWLLAAPTETCALEIYFARHAETMANVSGVHSPEASTTFSPRGEQQITQLTRQLKQHHFDAILVSSLPRALNTILPYLQESGTTAEIWPELAECCWQGEPRELQGGELLPLTPIQLTPAQAPFFTFRDMSAQLDYRNSSYADGVMQVAHALTLIEQRYRGSDKAILIIAHYHSGQVFFSQLLGTPRRQLPSLKNGELIHLQPLDNGRTALQPVPLGLSPTTIAPE